MKKLILFILLFFIVGCGSANLEDVKQNAPKVWESNGFEIVGYQGYLWYLGMPGTSYGGALVWYTLHKIPDNGIIYQGAIQRWGDEYHIYFLRAKDAIQPE